MQKIIPHLWYDKEAKEAAEFYTTAFSAQGGLALGEPDSKINNVTTIHDTPSGDCEIVSFELMGYKFMSISAGPIFKLNPSVSFILNFDPSKDVNAKQNLDMLWEKLSESGKALMPLDKYPFSERYGWIQDKYGVSWQLMLTDAKGDERPFITPSLMFTKDAYGKAEEAMQFYMSIFGDSKQGQIARWPSGMEPEQEGKIMYADFTLLGQWFACMESANEHKFEFNEAISLIVKCDTQEEIDKYWEALSAVPESEQCGWLKDKFGVSWQIVPSAMDEMMASGDKEKMARVTAAFLKMKKFDIKKLEEAAEGEGR